jgi:predicted secreted protein
MSKILGKDVTLSIVVNSSPQEIQVIGCARDCSLVTSQNLAGKSTTGSGIFLEFTALSITWSCSVNGFATIDENMDMRTLRQMQFTLQPIIISFKEVQGTTTIYYSGYAYIQSIQVTGSYADAETYSVQLQGTGQLLFDTIAVYGDAPTGLETTFLYAGELMVVWAPPALTPVSYTLRVTDYDLNTTVYYEDIPDFDGYFISIITGHHYAIAVQSDYGALGKSLFSPDIYYP